MIVAPFESGACVFMTLPYSMVFLNTKNGT